MLIAQVTDIHAAPDNNHLSRLERVLSWLSSFKPDILVVTGDLTDGCWPEGYAQIASMLAVQPYPSLLLPGNADNRDLMRQQWGNEQWAHDASGEALHFSQSASGLQLIGLDTSVSEQSYGDVTGHLEWLNNQLDAAGEAPVLLFLHHHLFPTGIPTLDETMCCGLSEFGEVLRRTPARLLAISSGHVHRPVAGTFAGIQASICGSVCPANPLWFGADNFTAALEPPMMMIHRYEEKTLSSHHVCVT
ncbi:metallophosphoesterase [Erwiniaceae bacterium L1_55_4]|jgi:3',5'-cyclic-AMP phosphodiesterase|nr:metallophosphoesterase [Erwiniaceae bacterium L1_55_4]